jgi:AcrR family transcriptional regulator
MAKDDARARILEAAGPIFAEKGYETATVRDICQKAGVNVAAVNYYFGDKERLYIETVKRAHQPAGEPEPLLEWPPDTPPETKLRDFIGAMLGRMLGERAPWQRQLMMREILNPTSACAELVRVYFRRRFGQLLDILDEILPAETPAHRRHQICFSIVGQALYYHVGGEIVTLLVGHEERRQHYQVHQLAEHISGLMLASLGRTPPLAEPSCGPIDPTNVVQD